jgi:hypothetical protein
MGVTMSRNEHEKDPSKYYLTSELNNTKIVDCVYSMNIDNCQQITQFYCNTIDSHGFVVFQTIGSSADTFICHLSGFPNQLYISTEKTTWNPNSRDVHTCDLSVESLLNFNSDFAKRFGAYDVKTNNCQTFATQLSSFLYVSDYSNI